MQQAPPIDPHFSILVAGHRPHRLPTDAAALHAIESAIDRLVAHIATQLAELVDCEPVYGRQAPRRCVTRPTTSSPSVFASRPSSSSDDANSSSPTSGS